MLGGHRVTSPLRTVIDIVRIRQVFGSQDMDAVRGLARIARLSLDDCLTELQGRRNLPDKRRAALRLEQVLR